MCFSWKAAARLRLHSSLLKNDLAATALLETDVQSDAVQVAAALVIFERAWDKKAYDNGRRHNQLTVASDLIFHF